MPSRLIDPEELLPPHKITHPEKAVAMAQDMLVNGWDHSKPDLVGYYSGGMLLGPIQLLSGTHRRAAAVCAGIKVPVKVWDKWYVESAWGTPEWTQVMGDKD